MAIVTTDDKHYKNIANAIREKIGNTDLLKPEEMAENVLEVYEKGKVDAWKELKDWSHLFYNGARLDLLAKLKYDDTSNATTCYNMFYGAKNLTEFPAFNLANVTTVQWMFAQCNSLITAALNNTNKCTNFQGVFINCSKLTELVSVDTSNGTNFQQMFGSCSSLTKIPSLDTSKGTNFASMFSSCSSLTEIPSLDTSKGADLSSMFNSCSSLTKIPSLDTSACKDFASMFSSCSSLTEIPSLDTSNANNGTNDKYALDKMFYSCTNLITVNGILSSKYGCYMANMFYNCTKLENVRFSTIKVISNITTAFKTATALTVDSLMSIINALQNSSTTTYTVTIGSTNLAKLTEEQIAIATAKNIKLS